MSGASGPYAAGRTDDRARAELRRRKRADLECGDCHQRFSKPEHLTRHMRIHSGAKPFVCNHPGCEKGFNRVDSLARHLKMHDKAPTTGTYGAGYPDPETTVTGSEHRGLIGDQLVSLDGDRQIDPMTVSRLAPFIDNAAGISPISSSTWPDIDDLVSLLSSDAYLVDSSGHVPDMSNIDGFGDNCDTRNEQQPTSLVNDHARQAVQSLSSLLHKFSLDLAREVEEIRVTADFLDTCLASYFQHFHPIFPVIHEPTFATRDCTPILLVAMTTVGSLFLAAGGATAKGEALWKIANAAIATSWQSLLTHGASSETTPGKQLMLTSLLGQAYAVLSANRSLKLTSQALRGMSFYWTTHMARSIDASMESEMSWRDDRLDVEQRWKIWADREVQRRAMLWHYVLDGLISQSCGSPNGIRHTTNNIPLPCSDEAFEAATAGEWFRLISDEPHPANTTSRELLLQLFAFEVSPGVVPWAHTSIPMVIEALQSLVTETREAGGPSVGLPSRSDISKALWRLYDSQIKHELRPNVDVLDLSIRWHVICIGLCADPIGLLHDLCRKEASQRQFQMGNSAMPYDPPSLIRWQSSDQARRAMLHATAAINLMQHLPLGNMHALHIPLAVSTITTIMLAAESGAGSSKFLLPEPVCWKSVCDFDSNVQEISTPSMYFVHQGSIQPGGRSRTLNYTTLFNALRSLRACRDPNLGCVGDMEAVDKLLQARLQFA